MRPAYRPGTRPWLLLPAAVLVLSGLQAAIKSALGKPSLTTVAAVVSSITQVKTSASNLQNAASGKCQ